MSNVPKGRRQESDMLVRRHFYQLRKAVTDMILNDFGYRPDKADKDIQHYRETHQQNEKIEETCERLKKKNDSFVAWFVDTEAKAVLDLLRNIETEFSMANSIYPSETPARLFEFLMRRRHMNKAIGYCFALKQEINYVIRTLPTDKNKIEVFSKEIDLQIRLYRGVRQADNRLIRSKNRNKTAVTIEGEIVKIFDGIANLIRKIGRIEENAKELI